MWALLEKDGTPSWFGPEPVPGAEDVGDVDAETLVACRRTKAGKWVKRTPKAPPEPTAEEQAAQARAAFQAALETRRQAVADAMRTEADPLFFEWQAGEGTEEAWRAKRRDIKARYPRPEEEKTE